MSDKFDFTNKIAVVVGASKGIGLTTAKGFAYGGANTYFLSRSGSDEDVKKLNNEGKSAYSFKVDATDEEAVESIFREIISKHQSIDILVNCIAINQCVPIEKISLQDWNKVVATNLTSIFLTSKFCLKGMKERKSGKIINVSSVAARNKSPVSGVHYVATKAAILGFTRQLAKEAAPFGINVNATCPGQTLTPMLKDSMSFEAQKKLAESIPLGRIATPKEQADVILFLASEAASYLSGSVIDVNGGQL